MFAGLPWAWKSLLLAPDEVQAWQEVMVVVGKGVRIQACWDWFFSFICLLLIPHFMLGSNPMGPSLCLSLSCLILPYPGLGGR